MNAGNIEKVVFRFRPREVAALLKLMNAPKLPGTSIEAEMPDQSVVEGMVDAGIVMPFGERTYVDSAVSLIMQSAIGSSRFLAAESEAGSAVLYEGEALCVLAEEDGRGPVKMEPLPNLAAAKGAWLRAAGKLKGEVRITLTDGEHTITRTGGEEAMNGLFAQFEKR